MARLVRLCIIILSLLLVYHNIFGNFAVVHAAGPPEGAPAPAPASGPAPAPASGPAPALSSGPASAPASRPAPGPNSPPPPPAGISPPAPAPLVPGPVPPTTNGAPPPKPKGSSKLLSGGQKAGIVIGVFAAVGATGFGGMVYKKRRDNMRRSRFGFAARRTAL